MNEDKRRHKRAIEAISEEKRGRARSRERYEESTEKNVRRRDKNLWKVRRMVADYDHFSE